jgi:hypothetical protein
MVAFPSVEWFQRLAAIANDDPGFQKFGTLEAVVAFRCGGSLFSVTFDVRDVRAARAISEDEAREADFVIDLPPAAWRAMIEDIRANGRASGAQTLNSLDLLGDEPVHVNLADDGYRADKFFRYNPSLQRFIDNASTFETEFALDAAPA